MNILVSNDDGINSIGLIKLVKELSKIATVYVCAPDSQRSAYSHHFTLSGKMKIEERIVEGAIKAYALWGTPVDCVRCARLLLFKDIQFDLVISGINSGWNVSSDAIYSGTVAAASEGLLVGVPSIAMSLSTRVHTEDYEYAAKVACDIAIKHVQDPNNKNFFLNVNVPLLKEEEIKGYKICDSFGIVEYDEGYYYSEDKNERFITIGPGTLLLNLDKNDRNIDVHGLEDGYVTITPYTLEQTHKDYVQHVKELYSK